MSADVELLDDVEEASDGADRGGAGTGVRNRFKADPFAAIVEGGDIGLLTTSRRQACMGSGDQRKPVDRAGSEQPGQYPSRAGRRLYWPDGRVTDLQGAPL